MARNNLTQASPQAARDHALSQIMSNYRIESNVLRGSFPPSSIQSDSTGSGGGHDNGSGNRIGPPSLPSIPNNDRKCLYTPDDLNLCGGYDNGSGMYTRGEAGRSSLSSLGNADGCDNGGGGVGVSNVKVVPNSGGDIRVVHQIDPPPLPSIRNNEQLPWAGATHDFPPLPPRLPLSSSWDIRHLLYPKPLPATARRSEGLDMSGLGGGGLDNAALMQILGGLNNNNNNNNRPSTSDSDPASVDPKTSPPPSSSNNSTPPEQPKEVNHNKRGSMASETTENGTKKKARSSSNSSTNTTTTNNNLNSNPNANHQNMFGYPDVEEYTGCLVSHQYSGIGDTDAIIKRFLDDCQSRDFAMNCFGFGFLEAKFHPNPHLTDAGNTRRQKFSQSIASDSVELEKRSAHLGMVFHGTHTSNIQSILKDGLDMKRRKGQGFGPGEYFSTKPGTSVSYCKGGLEMLVFVVVIPPASERSNYCPSDYVIVDNNCHQLPLGVLKFTSVDEEVRERSNARRREYFDLCRKVRSKTQIKEETKIKADIIKKIIMEDIDSAAQTYENKDSLLTELSRKEVSWYVNKHLDKNVIPAFFPNLPNPMTLDEMRGLRLHNLENAVEEEKEAKDKLDVHKLESAVEEEKEAKDKVEVAHKHRSFLPPLLLPQQQHYHPLSRYPQTPFHKTERIPKVSKPIGKIDTTQKGTSAPPTNSNGRDIQWASLIERMESGGLGSIGGLHHHFAQFIFSGLAGNPNLMSFDANVPTPHTPPIRMRLPSRQHSTPQRASTSNNKPTFADFATRSRPNNIVHARSHHQTINDDVTRSLAGLRSTLLNRHNESISSPSDTPGTRASFVDFQPHLHPPFTHGASEAFGVGDADVDLDTEVDVARFSRDTTGTFPGEFDAPIESRTNFELSDDSEDAVNSGLFYQRIRNLRRERDAVMEKFHNGESGRNFLRTSAVFERSGVDGLSDSNRNVSEETVDRSINVPRSFAANDHQINAGGTANTALEIKESDEDVL